MTVRRSYNKAITSLAAKAFYVIGPGGDDDPGIALDTVVIVNDGTTDFYVGHSLTGILSGARYQRVLAQTALPFEGPLDNLIIYNPEAATAAVFSVAGSGCKRNSGADAGVLCQEDTAGSTTRYQIIRPTRTAGETKDTVVPVKYQRGMTTIKAYSVTKASGGTITCDLLNPAGLSMLDQILDQEAVTDATLYTTRTLSSANGSLTVNRNLTLRCVSSAGGDTLNDFLVELAHTVV